MLAPCLVLKNLPDVWNELRLERRLSDDLRKAFFTKIDEPLSSWIFRYSDTNVGKISFIIWIPRGQGMSWMLSGRESRNTKGYTLQG